MKAVAPSCYPKKKNIEMDKKISRKIFLVSGKKLLCSLMVQQRITFVSLVVTHVTVKLTTRRK